MVRHAGYNLAKQEKRQLKKSIAQLVDSTFVKFAGLDFVRVRFDNEKFDLIGQGCSSAVFRSKEFPFVAVKVYSPECRRELFNEVAAYRKTAGLRWFPHLFFYGRGYLAIEYVEGQSLYEYLLEGKEITDEVLREVDLAIEAAREKGLKPSDIHFKNVLVCRERVMLVDLSDYLTATHANRWLRIKFFYRTVYKPFLKKVPVPKGIVDFFRKAFKIIEKFLD